MSEETDQTDTEEKTSPIRTAMDLGIRGLQRERDRLQVKADCYIAAARKAEEQKNAPGAHSAWAKAHKYAQLVTRKQGMIDDMQRRADASVDGLEPPE